jgi:hypothetical protein
VRMRVSSLPNGVPKGPPVSTPCNHLAVDPTRRHGLQNVSVTWVTLWAERIFDRFKHSGLQIEVSQVIIHETDQPDVVVEFFDVLRRLG